MSDNPKVTQQAALTTASGRLWLIVAGIIAVLCLLFLWFLRDFKPLGAATTGIVTIVVVYLGMVAVRFGVRAPRVRLWLLAIMTLGIVATFIAVAATIILSS